MTQAKNSGMLVRHFEHPESGLRSTLEIPQGWAKHSYFRVTLFDKDGKQLKDPETVSFATPGEAREGAAKRERFALEAGWRPRMASNVGQSGETIRLYHDDGRPIAMHVTHCAFSPGGIDTVGVFDGSRKMTAPPIMRILATGDVPDVPQFSETIIVQHRYFDSVALNRGIITAVAGHGVSRGLKPSYEITCDVVPLDDRDYEAMFANAEDRERRRIIADYVTGPCRNHGNSFEHLWALLDHVADASERTLICKQIVERRIALERRAAKRREQERLDLERIERTRREREQAEAATRAANEEYRRRTREMLQSERMGRMMGPPVPEEDQNAKKRRLTGGRELGKQKQRKINLGD